MQLPAAFEARMKTLLGAEYPAYRRAMEEPPRRGLRVNTQKIAAADFLRIAPFALAPTGLAEEGFLLGEDAPGIGAHPLHRAGLFYMQEPTAMAPARLLGVKPGMRALDLCAAPGGKAGQLAAYLGGKGLLVANEVIPSRAALLQGTLERLGARNALVCSMQPDALANALEGYFDAVLVDAPCSGEGMFRKEPQAIRDWSVAHVQACAARQAGILNAAARAVRPGGRLVYSTCTFAPEEDEETVAAFLARHPAFTLLKTERYYPHTGPGEGHFAALLCRAEDKAPEFPPAQTRPLPADARRAWETFVQETLTAPPEGAPMLLPDGRIMLLPEETPAAYEKLFLKCAGVHAADYRNGRIVPGHALALAYPAAMFQRPLSLSDAELAEYFQGNTVPVPADAAGFCAVCAQGFPVGWGKAVSGTLKNHLPKGLRK